MSKKPDDWRNRLTVPLWDAAPILGIGRSSAYEAAKTGQIPVLVFGRRKVVPVAWLKKAVDGPEQEIFTSPKAPEAA